MYQVTPVAADRDRKICHLSTVHPRDDVRIFHKQCKSLQSAGFNVTLLVNDGLGKETRSDVDIEDIASYRKPIPRIIFATPKMALQAIRQRASIYHFHDPELLPVGFLLSLLGKKVIYDVHEDVAGQLLDKPWIAPVIRPYISKLVGFVEKLCSRKICAVSCATPHIATLFTKTSAEVVAINNYPIIGELNVEKIDSNLKSNRIVYVGNIAELRGIRPLVSAMSDTSAKLDLVGKFWDQSLRNELRGTAGWSNVEEYGLVDRDQLPGIMSKAFAGIVTFLPSRNTVYSQPNKMFEYMSAGLPVVGSNFPLWREIIEGADCGICVDPSNKDEIASAINRLLDDPDLAMKMGSNGLTAINEKYNWTVEAKKLVALYEKVL